MSIRINCPQCNMVMQAPAEYAGKRVRCKSCGSAIVVPEAPAGEEAFGQLTAEPPAVRPERTKDAAEPNRRPDRPRTPAKPSGSSSGMVLLIILGIVGVLSLCCACPVGVGALFYFRAGEARDKAVAEQRAAVQARDDANVAGRIGSSKPAETVAMDAAELKRRLGNEYTFLPDSISDLHVRKIDVLRKSAAHQRLNRGAGTNMEFDLGIRNQVGEDLPPPPDLLKQITTLTQMRIYMFRRPVSEKDIATLGGSTNPQKVQLGNRAAWRDQVAFTDFLWVADGATLVAGPEEMVRAIFARTGAPKMRPEIAAALRAADFTKPDVQLATDFEGLRGNGVLDPRIASDVDERLLQAIVMEADWNSPVNIVVRALCKDAEAAARAKREFDSHPASDHPGLTATRNGNTLEFRSSRPLAKQ